jgi:hypothetical protein
MTIQLTAKQVAVLDTAYNTEGHTNGYQALKSQLSPANKAKLRGQCDKEGFISDNDLIYAIIDALDTTGLDL